MQQNKLSQITLTSAKKCAHQERSFHGNEDKTNFGQAVGCSFGLLVRYIRHLILGIRSGQQHHDQRPRREAFLSERLHSRQDSRCILLQES